MTDDRIKNIENVRVGDSVNGDIVWHIYHSGPVKIYSLMLEDGTHYDISYQHFVLTKRGIAEIDHMFGTKKLVVGDEIKTLDGWKKITSITYAYDSLVAEVYLTKKWEYWTEKGLLCITPPKEVIEPLWKLVGQDHIGWPSHTRNPLKFLRAAWLYLTKIMLNMV
jgi:hypothetical protein